MPSLQGVSGPEALAGGEDAWAVESNPGDGRDGEPAVLKCPQSGLRAPGRQGTREGAGAGVL